jgi:group I intron endonuclease
MGHIYRILNKVNGKSYIGQTNQLKKRWYGHIRSSYFGTSKIGLAIKKYGIECFEFIILEENCDPKELDKLEKQYISFYNTNMTNNGYGYNLTEGGSGIRIKNTSEETKKIMSLKKKEFYKKNPESKKQCSNSMKELWKNKDYIKMQTTQCHLSKEELIKECENLSWDDMASKFCVSVSTIKKWFKHFNIEKTWTKKLEPKKWSKEEEQKLLSLRESGLLVRDISKLMNRSELSIKKRLQKLLMFSDIKRSRYVRKKI